MPAQIALDTGGSECAMVARRWSASGSSAAPAQTSETMTVTVKILRYNPEVSEESRWESYQVSAEPTDRVLDALEAIVEALVPKVPPTPNELKEAAMLARARTAVIDSGDWMTAAEIAAAANFSTTNPSAQNDDARLIA